MAQVTHPFSKPTERFRGDMTRLEDNFPLFRRVPLTSVWITISVEKHSIIFRLDPSFISLWSFTLQIKAGSFE